MTFYLDLDRTAFRTDCVFEVYDAIEKAYPDNDTIRGGYDKRSNYYIFPHEAEGDATTYYHDMVGQLQAAGLDYQQVFDAIRPDLSDGRLEYPGLEDLLSTLARRGLVKVLTYGEDRYQRFRASLCPSLHGVEVVTLVGQKSEYLNMYASPGDWIVDDKRIDGLEVAIRSIQILHNSKKPTDVKSLYEVGEIISSIDNARQ